VTKLHEATVKQAAIATAISTCTEKLEAGQRMLRWMLSAASYVNPNEYAEWSAIADAIPTAEYIKQLVADYKAVEEEVSQLSKRKSALGI
jgi:hypothetical protein